MLDIKCLTHKIHDSSRFRKLDIFVSNLDIFRNRLTFAIAQSIF